jgi:HD-GYP domain-containing protein (c-di-GMP phosphodiesterase class II)
MLYSIIKFYKSLFGLKIQTNEQKIFADWVYKVTMALMLFFLAGYIAVDIVFISLVKVSLINLIVSLVFFLGALFVFTVLTSLKHMSVTISKKTEEIIKTLVNTIEAKDKYTQGHSVHVANVSGLIYDHLPGRLRSKINRAILIEAAILHDIGKIGIPDSILNKPCELTQEERNILKRHTTLGKRILEPTSYRLIGEIIYHHHERIDGKGYHKITAEHIPLESKIIAIADTFSALYTDRSYRPKRNYEEALQIIQGAAGTQLDADITEIFCAIPKNELENVSII